MNGIIKKVNSRGYGWITAGDIDFFLHRSDFIGDWRNLVHLYITNEGRPIKVGFEVDKDSKKGPKAKNVTLEV